MGASGVRAANSGFNSYNHYQNSQTSVSEIFDLRMQGAINGRRESYGPLKHTTPADRTAMIQIPHMYRRMSAASSPTAADSLTPLGLTPIVASLSAEAQFAEHVKTSPIGLTDLPASTNLNSIPDTRDIPDNTDGLLNEPADHRASLTDQSSQHFMRSISQSSNSEEDPLFKELETSEVAEPVDDIMESSGNYGDSESLRRDTVMQGSMEEQASIPAATSHILSSDSSSRPVLGVTVDFNLSHRSKTQLLSETEANCHFVTPCEINHTPVMDSSYSPTVNNICQELALPPKYPTMLPPDKSSSKGSPVKHPKLQSNNSSGQLHIHQQEETPLPNNQQKPTLVNSRSNKALDITEAIRLSSDRQVASDPLTRTRSRRGSQLFTAVATGLRNLLGGESGETSCPNKGSQQLAIAGRNSSNNDPLRRHSIANHSPASDDKTGAVAQLVDYLETRRRFKEVAIKLAMPGSNSNVDEDKIDLVSTADGSPQPPSPPEVNQALFIPKPEAARAIASLSMSPSTPMSPLLMSPAAATTSNIVRLNDDSRRHIRSMSTSKILKQMSTGTEPLIKQAMSESGSQTYTRLLIDACTQTEITRIEKIHRTTQVEDQVLPSKMT